MIFLLFCFLFFSECYNLCLLSLLDLEESTERRSPVATGLWEEEEGPGVYPSTSLSLSLFLPAIQPSPPLASPPLTWALPLAERWDSFTEAAGCQERASPRKAGQMYVGHCESEGGFSFSYSLLFSPPFCSCVLSCLFLFLWLTPSTLMSEKITLICVSPVYYSPGLATKTRPNKIWSLVLLTY